MLKREFAMQEDEFDIQKEELASPSKTCPISGFTSDPLGTEKYQRSATALRTKASNTITDGKFTLPNGEVGSSTN